MELVLSRCEHLHGKCVVDLVHVPEHGPAELHAALHDAGAVLPNDPLHRRGRERSRSGRRGVKEDDLVEAQADLRVRGLGELVQVAEEGDVGPGKSWVGLQAFQKGDWGKRNNAWANGILRTSIRSETDVPFWFESKASRSEEAKGSLVASAVDRDASHLAASSYACSASCKSYSILTGSSVPSPLSHAWYIRLSDLRIRRHDR